MLHSTYTCTCIRIGGFLALVICTSIPGALDYIIISSALIFMSMFFFVLVQAACNKSLQAARAQTKKAIITETERPTLELRQNGRLVADGFFKCIFIDISGILFQISPKVVALRGHLVTCQHWFRLWLGVVRHQVINCTDVGPDERRHNELNDINCNMHFIFCSGRVYLTRFSIISPDFGDVKLSISVQDMQLLSWAVEIKLFIILIILCYASRTYLLAVYIMRSK